MKNIFKSAFFLALVSAGMTLTGCIDEVHPTYNLDQGQLDGLAGKGEALIEAMPGFMVNWNTQGAEWHGDFGYSSMMHIRDLMTGDMTTCAAGLNYNQWSGFERASMTASLATAQYIWNYYTKQILTTNKAAEFYHEGVTEDSDKGGRAVALAFRAMLYLDIARWYEFLQNEGTSSTNDHGNNVLNLTVPIVTEKTLETDAYNNPRATRQQMFDFIKSDLDYAVANIQYAQYSQMGTLLPNLACVYGLYARLFMWVENYSEAAKYADMAIREHGGMDYSLTEDEWNNPTSGFNSFDSNSSWMWGLQFEKENESIQTGICNWTSMISPEAVYGYASFQVGAAPVISADMYDRISDTDFRKLSWMVTDYNSPLLDKLTSCLPGGVYNFLQGVEDGVEVTMPLACLKFRPGFGSYDEFSVGSSVAVPIMRLEEMLFIKFEAVAHTSGDISEFKQWMTDYRDPNYATTAASIDDMVEEIVFQKRVELWGEGHTLFDIKRLNYSVTRRYDGTNFRNETAFNTVGRPAWMNMVFVQTEGNSNSAMKDWNNPEFASLFNN